MCAGWSAFLRGARLRGWRLLYRRKGTFEGWAIIGTGSSNNYIGWSCLLVTNSYSRYEIRAKESDLKEMRTSDMQWYLTQHGGVSGLLASSGFDWLLESGHGLAASAYWLTKMWIDNPSVMNGAQETQKKVQSAWIKILLGFSLM